MSFLNATLVFGTLAAIVPIVLHLIARREPRRVVFPSITFLTKRYESNHSRLKVRRWWLLALRILAVAALALALARPAIHQSLSLTYLTIALIAAAGVALMVMASVAIAKGQSKHVSMALLCGASIALVSAMAWGTYAYASSRSVLGPSVSMDQRQPVAVAIVLDNSPTAAWKSGGEDRIATMQNIATDMVSRLPTTSRIAIVDRSTGPTAFSLDFGGAISKIEQVRARQDVSSIASRIDAAARLLRTSDIESRQILIITDLAVSTWDRAVTDAGLSETFGQDPPIGLVILDLGQFEGRNRSLSIPRIADPTPAQGTAVPITTTLSVFSSGRTSSADDAVDSSIDSGSVTAELEIYESDPSLPVVRDGVVVYPNVRRVDRTNTPVTSESAIELLLTIPSLDVGVHHGRIRLTGDDAMPLDDVRYFTLSVLPPSSVLLMGDDKQDALIIEQTIAASPLIGRDESAEFQVERITSADLAVVRLPDYDAIILLDPPPMVLADPAMADYVRGGGGVLVTLGPSAGHGADNEAIESRWLPDLVRRWRVPEPGSFFQIVGSPHSIVEPVARNTPWSDFRVFQYWQIAPSSTDRVLIRLAGTEHPAMVLRRPGERETGQSSSEDGDRSSAGRPGKVLVLTTPLPALSKPARSWNDLFGTDPWPAWLLVRQSIEFLTGRGEAELMGLVGRPQVVSIGTDSQSTNESPSESTRLQLFSPGQSSPAPLQVGTSDRQVVISDVPVAGTYWIRGGQIRGVRDGAGFSANLPAGAITTERIGVSTLDQVFGADRYDLVADRDEIQWSTSGAASRVLLESPAMLLALIVFLLEQILGNRFYRKS